MPGILMTASMQTLLAPAVYRGSRLCLLSLAGALSFMNWAEAQLAPEPQAYIELLKKGSPADRATAASKLTEKWQDSLVPIVADIASYDTSTIAEKSADTQNFQNVTDVLRSIIVNKDGAIKVFRERANANKKAIENLILAARSPNKELRINATHVLANVVDNTNLCLLLPHFRDPGLTPDGRINLLQVAQVASSYAFKENAESTKKAVGFLKADLVDKAGDNRRTLAIADDILDRLQKNTNKDEGLPRQLDINNCKTFDFDALKR
jgi:hypothetical protein